MKFVLLIIFTGLILLLAQCKQRNAETNHKATPILDSESLDSLKNLTYLVLSPNEMLSDILTDVKSLNTEIVNPKNNAVKYINAKHQAMNLGVYIADFAYLNLTQNRTNALEYFKVIRDLAQKNNIYGCFDQAIFDRIQDNLANSDSLISISQEMYYNMSDILENSNRPKVYALISSGALVESLYLTVMNVTKYADYEPLARKLFEQEKVIQNLNSFISIYKDDPDIKSVYDQLQNLKKIMGQAERKSIKRKVIRDKNNHLEVKGGEDIMVTEKSFDEFRDKVIIIRNDIVNVSNK